MEQPQPPKPTPALSGWKDGRLSLPEWDKDLQTLFEFDRHATIILSIILLGNQHSCAIASDRYYQTGFAYQIMPDKDEDYDFFDWYCYKYPHDQFYNTPLSALMAYVERRKEWFNLGKPKPF